MTTPIVTNGIHALGPARTTPIEAREVAQIEHTIETLFPDVVTRHTALSQLLRSIDYAVEIAPSAWSVTLFPDKFRLNVGRVEALVVGKGFIRLNLIGALGTSPFVGRNFEDAKYRSVKSPKCTFVGSLAEFADWALSLDPFHHGFIEVAGLRKSGIPFAGTPFAASHSEALVQFARSYIHPRVADGVSHGEPSALQGEEILDGMSEGARLTIQANAYERSISARRACLAHYGFKCIVCGFDSGLLYGTECAGVIHVHHLVPLSEIRVEYIVDPIRDLRPVCPNCHAVIHSRNPAFSINEVKELIRSTVNSPTTAP